MHDPRLGLLNLSSWWSRPKVWPTSWHITTFLQAGVLYVAVLKYVSLTLIVPLFLNTYRRPDGSRWTGQQLDEATGGVVPRSYVTNLRKGRI
jgi:hypothetical protein